MGGNKLNDKFKSHCFYQKLYSGLKGWRKLKLKSLIFHVQQQQGSWPKPLGEYQSSK